jgi:hypothetical protein
MTTWQDTVKSPRELREHCLDGEPCRICRTAIAEYQAQPSFEAGEKKGRMEVVELVELRWPECKESLWWQERKAIKWGLK